MKILIQWTRSTPSDWVEVDSALWAQLPKRPLPRGGETIDTGLGWMHRLRVQGVSFTSDHFAVEDQPDGATRVYSWSDDPDDYPVGEKYATVTDFYPLAPDPRFGGAYNTRQLRTIYAEQLVGQRYKASGPIENTTILSWNEFVPPLEAITRHCIWTTDELNAQHEQLQSSRGWREWTEGVPEAEIVDGEVREQRPLGRYDIPKGTKTYFLRDTNGGGVHTTSNVDNTNEMVLTTAGAGELESESLAGGGSELTHQFTTVSGEPGAASWPTGNYRCQLDVTVGDTDITYGFRVAGTAAGHFAAVNSGLSTDVDTKPQTEALFSGSGLKLATTGSVTWTGETTTDRFEVLLAATRLASHGNQALELRYSSDAFADGPWTTATIESGAGSASGIGTATGVGQSTAEADGSAAGAATVSGVGQSTALADFLAAGAAAVTAVAVAIVLATGSSVGTATVTGVGQSTAQATASAAGTSTVTADTEAIVSSTASASGVATVTGVGQSEAQAVGNAAGTATVTAVGADANAGSVAEASGIATVTGVSQAIVTATGSSVGIATVVGDSESIVSAAGSAAGAATVTGVGKTVLPGIGNSSGTATVSAVSITIVAAVGNAAGTGTALAEGADASGSTAAAIGTSTATGVGSAIANSDGASIGIATVAGDGQAIVVSIGTAAGSSAVLGVGQSALISGVGNVAGSSTATAVGTDAGVVAPPPKPINYIVAGNPDGLAATQNEDLFIAAARSGEE